MDNLRGHFPDHDDAYDHARDYDPGEDDVGHEVPPATIGQDERRMQVRAYNFWATMLGERNFPSIEELDPETQGDFGPYSVLLDFSGGIEDPAIAYLGAKLADECGTHGPITRLSDVPSRSLLSRITDHYLQIIANQAPIGFEAEFVNQRGTTILYRGILLPFSSDNDTIDFIYGVINWKELADQQTADELLLQIDQALEPLHLRKHDEYGLADWADSPADELGILDLGIEQVEAPAGPELPHPLPSRLADAGDLADLPRLAYPEDADEGLADVLASARDLADEALHCEGRTREALYAAIGRAHDFWLAARQDREGFEQILEDAGLTMQNRAPATPAIKLVFGTDYDKTRITEYAAALAHADRLGLGRGALAAHFAGTPGGLKGVVAAERQARRGDSGQGDKPPRTAPRKGLARKLRKLGAIALADLPASGSEFTLLVARRAEDGSMVLLGEVADDVALLEKAARQLLA